MFADQCPVVVIKTPNGPVRINESDFDPNVHELADDHAEAASAPVEPVTPVVQVDQTVAVDTVQLAVLKIGRKFFVVDAATNEKVVRDDLAAAGYDTEQAAWAAIIPA